MISLFMCGSRFRHDSSSWRMDRRSSLVSVSAESTISGSSRQSHRDRKKRVRRKPVLGEEGTIQGYGCRKT